MTKQVASIGRVVHYILPDGDHVAAIVSRVAEANLGLVNLHVCVADLEKPVEFVGAVSLDESGQRPGTWHWCEYVPAIEVKDANKD